MPATPQYPWAQRRAANGRPEPYHVKYFEIGNESIHGNHANKPFRRYTPEQYVKYFNATVGAMKKVDPSILAGYVMDDAGGSWDPIVARGCAAAAILQSCTVTILRWIRCRRKPLSTPRWPEANNSATAWKPIAN